MPADTHRSVQRSRQRCISLFLSRSKGNFGIHQSHQVPNIPCDRSLNDVFLNQHLQWYHNFDSVSARKLVRALCENVNVNDALFSLHETIVKRNIAVENYKCRSPSTWRTPIIHCVQVNAR